MGAWPRSSQRSCLVRYHSLVTASVRVGIVGAGIVGCAAAFELARRGAEVTVIDSRAPGGGATQASAGILAPYIEGHHGGALLDLAVRGLSVYDAFVERVRRIAGVPFEYLRSGTIEIAEDEERARALQSRAVLTFELSAQLEWLDAARLRELEPATRRSHVGGLLCGAHGHVAPMPFLSALVEAARRHGAVFRESEPVRRVSVETEHCVLATDGDVLRFDRIVLSAGSWSSFLDPFDEIKGAIKPIRGQLVVLGWDGPPVTRVLWGRSCYLVPWENGTLLVGATSEDVGFDERSTVDGVRALLSAAEELIADPGSATFIAARVGLRPASDDGLPFIGPSARDPRVFYATGHFRNGILLAPLTAILAADYLLQGRQDPAFRDKSRA